MGMSKLMKSLPFRLVLGVAIGIIAGLIANESFMNLVVTLNYIFGQIISFCVPLIVIGFIAPSITKLGKNASRLLGVALILAYTSSLGAVFDGSRIYVDSAYVDSVGSRWTAQPAGGCL